MHLCLRLLSIGLFTLNTFMLFPQEGYIDTSINLEEVVEKNQDLGATKKTFKCDQCEEEFGSSADLKNHVKSDHKKAKELQKKHKGRTTEYNCPECNKALPSAREVKQHLDTEHKKTQALLGGNEDLDLSVKRAPPREKRVVIFQVSGKLHWPAVVLSEDQDSVTARLFNKKSVVKTVAKLRVEDFDYECHKYHISPKNSEHKHAFNQAKKLMEE